MLSSVGDAAVSTMELILGSMLPDLESSKRSEAHFLRIVEEARGSREELSSLTKLLRLDVDARPLLKNQRDPLAKAASASVSTERGRSEAV